jgi:hypothetical protein
MPRFRPRFSLLTTLLLMALVACAITIWQLWREVGPLRAEVRRLRDEVGAISIDDPTKLHAIQVETNDELLWKWRVWLPENRAYVVRCLGETVPKEGFPKAGGSIWLREPGEHVIAYRIQRAPQNSQWYGQLETRTASVGKDLQPWIEWSRKTSTSGGVGKSTHASDPAQRLELIRHRVSQNSDSSKIEDPAAGFMIWLEPVK